MRGSGRITGQKAMDSSGISMGLSILVSGATICSMEEVSKPGLTVQSMTDSSSKEKSKDRVLIPSVINPCIVAAGRIT